MTSSDRSSSASRRRIGARRKRASPKDKAREDPQLKPRTTPTQRRAESTIHLILETASVLIDEVGLHGMTTNLIAKRAPVRVSTVYRYFPNKLAIVAALSNRLDAELIPFIENRFEELADPSTDWRMVWRQATLDYLAQLREKPAAAAIRCAVKAAPELRALDNKGNETLAIELVSAFERRGVDAPHERLLNVARLLLVSAGAVLESAGLRENPRDIDIIDDMHAMHEAFLADYLD